MAVVKMKSKKRIPEQDFVSRKERDKKKNQRNDSRSFKVSQRETTGDF